MAGNSLQTNVSLFVVNKFSMMASEVIVLSDYKVKTFYQVFFLCFDIETYTVYYCGRADIFIIRLQLPTGT